MINHPSRSNPVLAITRAHIGRAHKITRQQMRDILIDCAGAGLVELGNDWGGSSSTGSVEQNAEAWTRMCRDISVVSVLAPNDDARFGSNPGDIRFDDPGSMHPQLRATLMFVGESAAERGTTIDYLRGKAKRVLIVEEAAPE